MPLYTIYNFFFFRILSLFNTHTGRGEIVLKKLIVVYIQNDLTLGYTVQALNIFNSYSFSNVGLTHCFFFLEYLVFLTAIHGERGECLKETNSGVYRKVSKILVLRLREKLMELL